MMRTWTGSQLQSIQARGSALLVAAGAGSGKTSVLVERVIRRVVQEGVDVDQLLVVTFTEAAAAEMKERIGHAILTAIGAPGSDRTQLARQLHLLDRALISTLHSFCLQVIRQAGVHSPAGPGFRVADEAETGILRELTLDQLLEAEFARGDPHFLAFVSQYGGPYGDREVRDWILRLYHFARSQPRPTAWLDAAICDLAASGASLSMAETHVAEPFFTSLRQSLALAHQALRQALRYALEPDGPNSYAGALRADLERVEAALTAVGQFDFAAFCQALAGDFDKLPADRKSDADLRKQVQDLRKVAKRALGRLTEGPAAASEAQLLAELAHTVAPMTTLRDLVLAFSERYDAAKRERGVADFSDLEHLALAVLMSPDGPTHDAVQWASRFAEVMVDEYQDTSPIQDAIITAVLRDEGRNLFIVGDVKQSIYRFRMAEPQLFLNKYHLFASGGAGQRIDLQENFRSRRGVVEAVNGVFAQVFTPQFGGLSYDERAQMKAAAVYPDVEVAGLGPCLAGPVEIVLIDRSARPLDGTGSPQPTWEEESGAESLDVEAQDDSDLGQDTDGPAAPEGEASEPGQGAEPPASASELSAIEQEALYIGRTLLSLQAQHASVFHPDVDEYQPFTWGDAAILFRANAGRMETVARVLRQLGIPCASETDGGQYDGYEMRLAVAIVDVIDNPHNDLPLATVLTSPLIGWALARVAEVRLCARADLHRAVVACAQQPSRMQAGLPSHGGASDMAADCPDLPQMAREFLATLGRWRTIARHHSVSRTLTEVFADVGLFLYARALPDGAIREANLRALIRQAEAYDDLFVDGIGGFARYLERHRAIGASAGAIGATERDVVRLMTIHKSKGLEFPVVFIAAMDKKLQPPARHSAIALHRQFGFGPVCIDPDSAQRFPTVASLALADLERRETLAEEARVLYVGMTRARERLYLVGSVRDLPRRVDAWCNAADDGRPRLRLESATATAGATTLPEAVLLGAQSYLDWIMPAQERLADPAVFSVSQVDPSQWLTPLTAALPGGDSISLEAASRLDLDALGHADVTCETDGFDELFLDDAVRPPAVPVKWSVTEVREALNAAEAFRSSEATLTNADPDGGPTAATAPWVERLRDQGDLRPRFFQPADAQALVGAARGTAFHRIMQGLQLTDDLADPQTVRRHIASLTETGRVPTAAADEQMIADVAAFFSSSLGRLMLQAPGQVRREVPFTMALPVAEGGLARTLLAVPEPAELAQINGDQIIVQGTIDCLIRQPTGLILIDYKTDRITGANDLAERIATYRSQLSLYAAAASRAGQLPVLAMYLYFVTMKRAVSLPVDEGEALENQEWAHDQDRST